ncbi:hypothetical protein HX776_21405 [Pseudomonas agarici]|uniref:DUF6279 family lipoprotein n=1 Tax=Pseudomonas agarici TaxID=46677 RepID=UPI0003113E0D|nr:DUF6279 family lipoprotein [Pseudomonas agarici]NWC11355.1 hypothetical protein [Pseudomonas agarici]SEL42764.1 hypothetical protein SAMN05216604_11838 [Pseudomonas agarici]
MSRRSHFLFCCLILGLALFGCNRVGVAYRHLDVIIPWTLSDYVDMRREQKDWFKEHLKEHLQWHCTTQLPAYLEWLDRLRQMVENTQVSDAQLLARTVEAKAAIAQVARQITPSAIELLKGLDARQVAEMNEAFAKEQRERYAEYVAPPLDEQIRQRAKRMSKRLEVWLGPLSPDQQQRVIDWSTELGEQNRFWIANRAHWQAQLSAAVAERQNADFPQRIEQLLQHRDSLWTVEYRQAYERTEQSTRRLLVDLMAESTPAQRSQLLKRIADLRRDFSQLSCLKAA